MSCRCGFAPILRILETPARLPDFPLPIQKPDQHRGVVSHLRELLRNFGLPVIGGTHPVRSMD
jgi:hypothetical protein